MHHLSADIERLPVKRENSGRGLIQLELTDAKTTLGLKKYLDTKTDCILLLINTYEKQKKKFI